MWVQVGVHLGVGMYLFVHLRINVEGDRRSNRRGDKGA